MTAPEAWLQGPVDGVPAPLQPVAHGLIQAREDFDRVLGEVPGERLWTKPGGAASIGYHARHSAGALDRLFTYARGEPLSDEQRAALAAERAEAPMAGAALRALLAQTVDASLVQLRHTDSSTLGDSRLVGRAALPSTVLGLLFHGAEHTARHAGQAITTARILAGMEGVR